MKTPLLCGLIHFLPAPSRLVATANGEGWQEKVPTEFCEFCLKLLMRQIRENLRMFF